MGGDCIPGSSQTFLILLILQNVAFQLKHTVGHKKIKNTTHMLGHPGSLSSLTPSPQPPSRRLLPLDSLFPCLTTLPTLLQPPRRPPYFRRGDDASKSGNHSHNPWNHSLLITEKSLLFFLACSLFILVFLLLFEALWQFSCYS